MYSVPFAVIRRAAEQSAKPPIHIPKDVQEAVKLPRHRYVICFSQVWMMFVDI